MDLMQQFFTLPDEKATRDLAKTLAISLGLGDVVLLHGNLGAGKTTFAKSFIRSYLQDHTLDVPSPTFTIVQHYGDDESRLDHYDCYRLEDPDEVLEIGLEDSFLSALTLIEWPDKIEPHLPEKAFLLGLKSDPDNEAARLGFLRGKTERVASIVWPETVQLGDSKIIR